MSNNSKRSPAADLAKEHDQGESNEITLVGGVRARLCPVPASLIDAVSSKIPEPEVPMWFNESKEREEPNPNHPDYVKALKDRNRLQGLAALDAMAMFGLELIDPIDLYDGNGKELPWVRKLKYMAKKGTIDISEYDLDDEMDREFVWKRFVAVDATVLSRITKASGITQEDIDRAEESFPGLTE